MLAPPPHALLPSLHLSDIRGRRRFLRRRKYNKKKSGGGGWRDGLSGLALVDSAPKVGDPDLAVPFAPTSRAKTRGKLRAEQMLQLQHSGPLPLRVSGASSLPHGP